MEAALRLPRIAAAGLALLLLAACSERYVASAGARSLVVVEDVVVAGDSVAARAIHILSPKAQRPLTGKAPLAQMVDHLEFDCREGRFASRGQRFILADGEVLDLPAARLDWKTAPDGSVNAAIQGIACDPEKARASSTRNSLKTLVRDYMAKLE